MIIVQQQAAASGFSWGRMAVFLAIGLALVLVGAAGGMTLVKAQPPVDQDKPGPVDVGFAQDMSVHHLQAVQMAGLAQERSGDQQVRQIAFDIERTQLEQVGRMMGWLGLWGHPEQAPGERVMAWMGDGGHAGMSEPGHAGGRMPGMASADELTRLRSLSGPQFDVLFLQLMIRHHQGGSAMADYAADNAAVPVVRNLADTIYRTQDAETDVLTSMLTARGAQPLVVS